jgi:hypothetical protein
MYTAPATVSASSTDTIMVKDTTGASATTTVNLSVTMAHSAGAPGAPPAFPR